MSCIWAFSCLRNFRRDVLTDRLLELCAAIEANAKARAFAEALRGADDALFALPDLAGDVKEALHAS